MSPSIEAFNEAKYKALMDGLECKEVNRSELERTLRIDSEFYSKSAIIISDMLRSRNHDSLTTFVNVSDGNHMGISDYFIDEGVPYYRGQDAGAFFIENSSPICIDEKTFELPVMKRSHLKKGDVILSIVGTIGSLSLVYSDKSATCSCKLAILRPKEGKNAELLTTFLSGKYGQAQITRYTRGAVQKGLILEDMDQLVVPVFGDGIVEAIRNAIQRAYQLQEKANNCYREAQRELVMSVGSISVPAESVTVRNISTSFYTTGRLDAEYYQPKYEAIVQKLDTRETVLSLCNLYDKNFNPDEKQSYKYIELADVGQSGDIFDVDMQYGSDLPTRARRIVKSGQIIVSSVEGSLQSCALITDEYDGTLCSTGFFVLDSDYINSETLLVLFKSETIQALMKQRCSGTILTAISKDELLSMPLPMIDRDVQKEIAAKVQESFALRKQSKQLLEYAKQAVEMDIEQGENVALRWLNDKISKEV